MNYPIQQLTDADSTTGMTLGLSHYIRDFFFEHGIPTAIGLATVGVTTGIMILFGDYFVRDHLIFFYLFPIAGIAMYFSSTPALVTSLGSAIAAAVLFP